MLVVANDYCLFASHRSNRLRGRGLSDVLFPTKQTSSEVMNAAPGRCSWTVQPRAAKLPSMITNRKQFGIVLACVAVLSVLTGQAAEARCLTPAEAQAVVGKGAVQRLSVIARVVGGEIVDARLCEGGGLLIYQLAVMRDGGRVDNITVDATSGQRLR